MASLPGPSQEVQVGDTVYLDGSASQSSTYKWAMTQTPHGSHCLMRDDGTATPSFVADAEGTYVLTLETDGGQQATVSIEAFARAEDPGPDVGEGHRKEHDDDASRQAPTPGQADAKAKDDDAPKAAPATKADMKDEDKPESHPAHGRSTR